MIIIGNGERDSESGNDYAQARYTMSRLARFSSPDPIAGSTSDPQSLNRYAYVRNSPVMLVDPTGMLMNCNTVKNSTDDQSTSSDSDDPGMLPNEEMDPAAPQSGCPGSHTPPGGGGDYFDGGYVGDDSGLGVTFTIGGGDPFGLLQQALMPTGWSCASGDCAPWQWQPIYGNIGLIGLLGSDPGDPTGPGDPGGDGAEDRQKKFQDCLKKFGDKYAQSNLKLKGFDAATAGAAAAGIDTSALLSLWENENKLQPNFGPAGPAGEIGPMQVRRGVAKELKGAGILPAGWNSDLQANLTTGALYYDRLLNHYNIPDDQAAAAYNGGPYGYKGKQAQGYQAAFNASQPGFINLINCMK